MKIIFLTIFLLSCSDHHKKNNAAPEKVKPVCQYEALEELSGKSGPFKHSLQCKEGYSLQDSVSGQSYKVHLDCESAGLNFDREGKYLKIFGDGVCPKEKVISTCVSDTFKVFLYDSDLSTDIESFESYCEDMGGNLK